MQTSYLIYKSAKIHYSRFGKGNRLLIGLHGFADDGSLFGVLQNSLSTQYTVYALDLPFHGKTKWPTRHFNEKDLIGIIALIQERERKPRIDLMGYSMGGRMVQKILFELIPIVDQIFLIAPDGLNTHRIFDINATPRPIQRAMHWLVQKPQWLIWIIKKAYQWRFITKFIHDFTYYHISTKEKRIRIFNTWRSLEAFTFSQQALMDLLRQHPTVSVIMVFGTRDEVIPPDTGTLFEQTLDNVQVYLIEEGHLLIDEKLNTLLTEIQIKTPH